MAESTLPPPRASASSTSPSSRTRNPVLYPTSANEAHRVQPDTPPSEAKRGGYDAKTIVTQRRDTPVSAMPSLAQPQRAAVRAPTAPPSTLSSPSPGQAPTKDPRLEDTAPHDPPPRRVRALPIPSVEDDAKALPSIPQRPVPPSPRPPVQEKRLEDAKTVYVVSDIVDALRADAGYEPLPRDPQRGRSNLRPSLWARLREWIRALRSK